MAVIKRIPVERLRPGMFVSRFELSWFKHPYLTSRLGVLGDTKTIAELKALGIGSVEIDLDRGLDVEEPCPDDWFLHQDEPPKPDSSDTAAPSASDPSRTLRFAKKLFTEAVDRTKHVLGGG